MGSPYVSGRSRYWVKSRTLQHRQSSERPKTIGAGSAGDEHGCGGGPDQIIICGPKPDGTYVVEFKVANGEALAISMPASETRVLKYFQERCPMGYSCRTLLN